MKWLIGLSAAQLLLLIIVGLRMIAIDMRTNDIADTADAAKLAAQAAAEAASQTPRPIISAAAATPVTDDAAAGMSANDDALRLIIREELAAWNASGRAAAVGGSPRAVTNSTRQALKPYDPAQAVAAQADFDRAFDRYKARGSVDTREMMELHAKIAELPPEAQRAALIKLTRAINNGEIEGNL